MGDERHELPPLPQAAEMGREQMRLDIGMAADHGFIVRHEGRIVCAVATIGEVCRWLDDEWRCYDPPIQASDMPNVVSMQQGNQGAPPPRASGWGRR